MNCLFVMLYVLSVLLANLTLDWFVPLPLFGLLSIGTVFFAAVFTLRDRIHRYGLNWVYGAIALALLVNLVAAWYLETPSRFIIASFLSILASELTDTAVFHRLRAHSWARRVLTSNAISVPLDSILFTLIAFLGVMSTQEMIEIVWADVLVKFSIAALLAINIGQRRMRTQTA